jgi:hypothetical protein
MYRECTRNVWLFRTFNTRYLQMHTVTLNPDYVIRFPYDQCVVKIRCNAMFPEYYKDIFMGQKNTTPVKLPFLNLLKHSGNFTYDQV